MSNYWENDIQFFKEGDHEKFMEFIKDNDDILDLRIDESDGGINFLTKYNPAVDICKEIIQQDPTIFLLLVFDEPCMQRSGFFSGSWDGDWRLVRANYERDDDWEQYLEDNDGSFTIWASIKNQWLKDPITITTGNVLNDERDVVMRTDIFPSMEVAMMFN